jgi:dTMP kinase
VAAANRFLKTGRFITLEGGEGAGKSTQCRLLADALAGSGLAVLRTREPGGASGAERLRALLLDRDAAWSPLAETLLHFAARAEHVERTIRPALAAGMWVVCDRFTDSTMAYQGWGLGVDRDAIVRLADLVGLRPDLTVVLDVSVPTSLKRLAGRGGEADRYERLGEGFFCRIRKGFRAVVAADPGRCVLVDAEGSQAEVARAVWGVVQERLARRPTPPPGPLPQGEGEKNAVVAAPPPLVGGGRGEGSARTTYAHARTMRQLPTPPERRLWRALRAKSLDGLKFRRQAPIGRYIVDFCCHEAKLVVEVDGITHAEPGSDAVRDAWLRGEGFLILRFWNNEIMANVAGVLETILTAAHTRLPP